MEKKHQIFLTRDEAIRAICIDFLHYEPQPLLFLELSRLILRTGGGVRKDENPEGVWISKKPGAPLKWMSFRELGRYLCRALEENPPSLDTLSQICSRTFQGACKVGRSSDGKAEGLWLHTGMETYRCRQCGECCNRLIYNNECSEKDYRRWQRLGREDILRWVQPVRRGNKVTAYQIWVEPNTNRFAETCPWLVKMSDKNITFCKIQDVKPDICRQYPGSRKHGLKTGCKGFDV